MTKKLYETNGGLYQFDARVLDCHPTGDGLYEVELDQTAFFPEGGGQSADTGTLGEARVLDVQLRGGAVLHQTDAPLALGQSVHGQLDRLQRFSRMQHHTGEHILSGTLHRLYGAQNVGFHMGAHDVTVDTNIPLTRQQILAAERAANRVVFENRPVRAFYPESQTLETLDYRSKKPIDGPVRIVEIDGCDRCACCAPHVAQTGEVGLIKVLDAVHYKGGMRLHLLCGQKAVEDYEQTYAALSDVAASLCVRQSEAADAVKRVQAELARKNGEVRRLSRELATALAQSAPQSDGHLCLFAPFRDGGALGACASQAAQRCAGVCVVFTRDAPHLFAAASNDVPLRPFLKEMNAALNGRGGGSDTFAQGSVQASQEQIESFFSRKNAR